MAIWLLCSHSMWNPTYLLEPGKPLIAAESEKMTELSLLPIEFYLESLSLSLFLFSLQKEE